VLAINNLQTKWKVGDEPTPPETRTPRIRASDGGAHTWIARTSGVVPPARDVYWQRSAGAVNDPFEEYQPLMPIDGDWSKNQEKNASSCG